MKLASAFALAILSLVLVAFTSQSEAGDDQQQSQNERSSLKGVPSLSGQGQQFRRLSDVVRSFKKKYHNQPSPDHGQSPVVPSPPIVTDPIPTPPPVVRDHRDPVRPLGRRPGGQIDTSGASGGVVVTGTPIVRDHRDQKPIIRDHRDHTGPIVRDHRD